MLDAAIERLLQAIDEVSMGHTTIPWQQKRDRVRELARDDASFEEFISWFQPEGEGE